jgi:hypothetical protein
MRQTILIISSLVLLVVVLARDGKTVAQESANDAAFRDQWEYLVVAGSAANLNPSGNPNLRKEPHGGFLREAFVLEKNMDKVGEKGWELVSVSGSSADPVYYFKRRK